MTDYIPDAGDIIFLDFDPKKGHEQAGERPAIVLSVRDLNKAYGVLLCCPMTTKLRGTPNEVAIAGDKPSVALSTHAQTIDFVARHVRFVHKSTRDELIAVRKLVKSIVGPTQ